MLHVKYTEDKVANGCSNLVAMVATCNGNY